MTDPAELTLDRLNDLLTFDPESGTFSWNENRGSARRGDVAGSVTNKGYVRISLDNVAYLAHRLVVFLTTGKMPPEEVEIDLKDGVKTNNCPGNLRYATHASNQHNRKRAQKNSVTGLLGVRKSKTLGKFDASIRFSGRQIHIGTYISAELAYDAYVAAKRKIHEGCLL